MVRKKKVKEVSALEDLINFVATTFTLIPLESFNCKAKNQEKTAPENAEATRAPLDPLIQPMVKLPFLLIVAVIIPRRE